MADEMGSIVGHVTDAEGGILPGVVVEANAEEGDWQRETVTNAMGICHFMAVPPGPYALTASMAGFHTQRIENVIVHMGQETRVEIIMQAQNVEETL